MKGVHVLIDAAKRLSSDAPIQVSLFGAQADNSYGRKIVKEIADDGRFRIESPTMPENVRQKMTEVDVCVVPSLWMETGPLVAIEALSAHCPVIGSRIGGIEEVVRDGIDGRLFPPGDSATLAEILGRLIQDRKLLTTMRRAIRAPRTINSMGGEVVNLYHEIAGITASGVLRSH